MLNITATQARALRAAAIEESILANLVSAENAIRTACAQTQNDCMCEITYPPCYDGCESGRYEYAHRIAERLTAAGFTAYPDITNEMLWINWWR